MNRGKMKKTETVEAVYTHTNILIKNKRADKD